jgi:hypothetical protein
MIIDNPKIVICGRRPNVPLVAITDASTRFTGKIKNKKQ